MGTFTDDPNRPDCSDCDRPMARGKGKAVSGRERYTCAGCGKSTTGSAESSQPPVTPDGYDETATSQRTADLKKAIRKGANRFVITAAPNNCQVNYAAWKSLLQLCEDRGAHLIVIPIHYKNVSLYTAAQEYSKWWASAVRPYLINDTVRLGHKTYVRADLKVQATAANPLSGMNPLAGDRWVIMGHSQMAMEPIATPSDDLPGRMYTTGAITQKSYSNTKAGAKADFHHITGALLVETTPSKTFIRQLNADGKGGIQDLTDYYDGTQIFRDQRTLGLTTGDEHVKFMLPNVKRATYKAVDSIVNLCRPRFIVRHDILDGYAGSHHHLKNYQVQYKKWLEGNDDYRAELDEVVDHINETTPTGWDCTNVLVQDSNHHDHLQMWLDRADDRSDHVNADLISELRILVRAAIREGRDSNPFQLYMRPRLTVDSQYVYPQKAFMIGNVDHSQHGHKGANGARGSANGFANTTHKVTIGHTHSARIKTSVFQVGKSCGVLEYESGLSSHTNTHCLQYLSGKRTLIDILGNAWRATNKPNLGELNVLIE